ncbi:GerMN domain-containing protein [Clostridium sp. 19966]|uniref:GerMN domain-containing protein n=1 Tax=Clostridium sp. 19966 TaxID=2768166 RepID=UPI0028DE7369|nr:GerMN domain-containing protein [Clostridium sp. 19966]MDT8718682.1 GerMN domain-containing protein [Clostridium sp. 19966]
MKKSKLLVPILLFTISTSVLYGCQSKDSDTSSNKEKVQKVQLPNEKGDYIDLSVYFDASSNEKDIKVAKEDVLLNKEEVIGQLLINQLISGPSTESNLNPVIPKDTKLISFSIKDKVAIVNFSGSAVVRMSAAKEEACLKSIVSTLMQLSSVSKVMILVDNKNVDTLGGNYNIYKPFGLNDIDGMKMKTQNTK